MSWKNTLDAHPELWNFNSWPYVDVDGLPQNRKTDFTRHLHYIKYILSPNKLCKAAKTFSVSSSYLSQLMTRCLTQDEYGEMPLTYALIPYFRIKPYSRIAEHNAKFIENGYSGEFNKLLVSYPKLVKILDEILVARIDRKTYAQVTTPESFHGRFKRELRLLGISHDQYPFNTTTLGFETLRKYMHKRTLELTFEKKNSNFNIAAKVIQNTIYAFDEIQMDEQRADAFASFYLELNDKIVPLRLSRVSVILAKDAGSETILGYHISLSKNPNQDDMLSVIDNIVMPWKPKILQTPGLQYLPGACFPSAVEGVGDNISFGTVKLDNAFIHLAHSVRDILSDIYGCSLNFGLPKQPTHRSLIEQAIKLVNQVTHSFDSTTGSNSNDSKRETTKNSKKIPVLSLNAFEEALEVVLANYNITRKVSLGGASPLQTLQYHIQNVPLPRMAIPYIERKSVFMQSKIATVNYGTELDRRAIINFLSAKYNGECLLIDPSPNKKVKISYDRRDIRKLKVFTLKGRFLGTVVVQGHWQGFKHSSAIRKYIHKIVRKEKFASVDPLAGVFAYLLKHKKLPEEALKIAKLIKQCDLNINALLEQTPSSQKSKTKTTKTTSNTNKNITSITRQNIPDKWSTTWVSKR